MVGFSMTFVTLGLASRAHACPRAWRRGLRGLPIEKKWGEAAARLSPGQAAPGIVARLRAVEEVGSFCCPVLPEPLESHSVARLGPTALLSE